MSNLRIANPTLMGGIALSGIAILSLLAFEGTAPLYAIWIGVVVVVTVLLFGVMAWVKLAHVRRVKSFRNRSTAAPLRGPIVALRDSGKLSV